MYNDYYIRNKVKIQGFASQTGAENAVSDNNLEQVFREMVLWERRKVDLKKNRINVRCFST
jgi:hypothetical protein